MGVGVRRGPSVGCADASDDATGELLETVARGVGEAPATGPGTAFMLPTIHPASKPVATARASTTRTAIDHVAARLGALRVVGALGGALDGPGGGAALPL